MDQLVAGGALEFNGLKDALGRGVLVDLVPERAGIVGGSGLVALLFPVELSQ